MNTFLYQAANFIFKKHSLEEIKNLNIILPSRRAVFYFKKELSQLSESPFFGPKVQSIDDFIIEYSNLTPLDNVELYFKLYDLFLSINPNLAFESFINWAPLLLNDFGNVDLALVQNPHLLFRYMSEAEAIKRWDITDFVTENSQKYFDFFENVSAVYQNLNQQLLAANQCYKGMAYRRVAENFEELNPNFQGKIYFVGLNALSNAEEVIVKALVKSKNAECIWDTDKYYMETDNKAGKKLRQYKRSGNYGAWNFISDDLISTNKNINVFEASNESIQAKLAVQLSKENLGINQVIVVLNEKQFVPLMLNLPSIESEFNITMGLPLNNSKIYALVNQFIDIQLNISESYFSISGSLFTKILRNAIFRKLINDEDVIGKIENKITSEQILFINSKWLIDNDLKTNHLDLIFKRLTPDLFIKAIISFVNDALTIVTADKNILEIEFCNAFSQKLKSIKSIFDSRPTLSLRDLKFLFNELLKSEKVPFSGDSSSDLQVMSMLETRCLDFESVTILSLNEGDLPSAQKNNSLIPFEASMYFDMPVYTDQDAIMAYHFFRLLQRAKNINLIYLKGGGNGVGTKERSRLITQIEEELLPKNKNINFKKILITDNSQPIKIDETIEIVKNEVILTKISKFLTEKGFYPTSLNTLLHCNLKFYWNQIEFIKPIDEISPTFQANVFGNIIHYTLEALEKPYVNRPLLKADLENIHENVPMVLGQIISKHFKNFETNKGLNSIFLEIAQQLISNYYLNEIENYTSPIEILALEKKFQDVILVQNGTENIKVKIAGKIDKLEKKSNQILVIDYKTGSISDKFLGAEQNKNDDRTQYLEKIESQLNSPSAKNDVFRQLFLYTFLARKEKKSAEEIIIPKIVAFRKPKANIVLKHSDLQIDEENKLIIDLISKAAKDLLNPDLKITQTEEIENCKYCEFNTICAKNIS